MEIGGNHNVCPVPGCGAVLGPSPFDHHRLVYDSLLDGLVAKVGWGASRRGRGQLEERLAVHVENGGIIPQVLRGMRERG